MRPFRTAVLIIGLLFPLVIQAQPFGDTEVSVFDTEFLEAPDGPLAVLTDAPVPDWVSWVVDPAVPPNPLPPISTTELLS